MFPEYPPEWDDEPMEASDEERDDWSDDESDEACGDWESWREGLND